MGWHYRLFCLPLVDNGQNALDAIMNAPVVRCDEAAWSIMGISLAGFNFLISTASALAIFVLLGKDAKR